MLHLSYDELFELAETAVSDEGFEDLQIQQLEHLKICKECYESFCLLCTLSDVMSENGSYVLSGRQSTAVKESVTTLKSKVLATICLIRKNVSNAVGAVMEQMNQAEAVIQFGPSLAMVTRGSEQNAASNIRLEEFEDEKTYIVFKPETNDLMLQMNTRLLGDGVLHVYLVSEDSVRVEIPLSKRGKIVKGSMNNIPVGDCSIVIEQEN